MSVFKIQPTTQQYDWGKPGLTSVVAQLASASRIPGLRDIDEGKPYAELWMGTHPTSPSRVLSSNQVLSDHLATHPELIGERVIERFGAQNGNLPFLFKVLSIQKALSIQSHPDKRAAEELHAKQPQIYKDDNHKPEMALAITPFRALCGFRPLPQIAEYLNSTPELAVLIPKDTLAAFLSIASSTTPTGSEEKFALKTLFAALMTTPETRIKSKLDILVARYQSSPPTSDTEIVDLVLTLSSQFPHDIGIFCAFLLNYIHLSPGSAIFLGAGEPHAYLSGDCIECMANSDNVIRAGLTPKLRDVPNLVANLTYEAADPAKHGVKPVKWTKFGVLYDPPVPEFSVVLVEVPEGGEEKQGAVGGPSIVVVAEGKGEVGWGDEVLEVERGDVFFVGAGTEIVVKGSGAGALVLYRAFVEVR